MINNLWYSPCCHKQNVGDLVGPYLFEKITGQPINYIQPRNTDQLVYLTVGSIIHGKYAKQNTIIWGSGILYGNVKKLGAINPKQICSVRGKLTRRMLTRMGQPCPEIYGDPALLLPLYYQPTIPKKHQLGIILHYKHTPAMIQDFLDSIPHINYQIISITNPVEEFIDSVLQCEYILSTSLHGIIIPHAYSIKSMPIFIRSKTIPGGTFKFEDYYSAFDIRMYNKVFLDMITDNFDLQMIENYYQPQFPIDTSAILEACPFNKKNWLIQ